MNLLILGFGTQEAKGGTLLSCLPSMFGPGSSPSIDDVSLCASSLGRSGGGAGKGRRACNYISGIGISAL